jgi:hypothetical protein
MQLALYFVLASIVAIVAVDAIARLDRRQPPRDEPASVTSSQKIVVDLSDRD